MSITEPSYCEDSIWYKGPADIEGSTDMTNYNKGNLGLLCDFFESNYLEEENNKSIYNVLFALNQIFGSYKHENLLDPIINNHINNQNDNDTERLEKILWDLYENCIEEDWDCYGAIAIEKTIIHKSIKFLKYLPYEIKSKLTDDNFCPNPHGTVTIDFYSSYGSIQAEIGLTKTNIIGEFENEEDPDEEEELTWENFKINDNNMSILSLLIEKVIYSE